MSYTWYPRKGRVLPITARDGIFLQLKAQLSVGVPCLGLEPPESLEWQGQAAALSGGISTCKSHF